MELNCDNRDRPNTYQLQLEPETVPDGPILNQTYYSVVYVHFQQLKKTSCYLNGCVILIFEKVA